MFNIVYVMFLIFIGVLVIAKLMKIIDQYSLCDIFGHDWERISLDVEYNKKKNVIEIVEKYKCKNCGKTKIERHIEEAK